jgi:hypothetical protein
VGKLAREENLAYSKKKEKHTCSITELFATRFLDSCNSKFSSSIKIWMVFRVISKKENLTAVAHVHKKSALDVVGRPN